jgi:hypothetical protein
MFAQGQTLLGWSLRCLHFFAARFITIRLDTVFLLLTRLFSCRHLARCTATAGAMMKEAATPYGQGTKQEQGEEGEVFCFHL